MLDYGCGCKSDKLSKHGLCKDHQRTNRRRVLEVTEQGRVYRDVDRSKLKHARKSNEDE